MVPIFSPDFTLLCKFKIFTLSISKAGHFSFQVLSEKQSSHFFVMWTSSGHACYTQILGQKVREDKYRGWMKERGFIL